MALSDLTLLRKTIADEARSDVNTEVGDGTTKQFKLAHNKVITASYVVYVDNVSQAETTNYTIDKEEGVVTFVVAPILDKEIKITYKWGAFSDEELTEFLALDGSVTASAVRCVRILLSDAARRFDYSAGQTDLKPSQVFDHLMELLSVLQEQLTEEIAAVATAAATSNVSMTERTARYYTDAVEEDEDLSREDLGV